MVRLPDLLSHFNSGVGAEEAADWRKIRNVFLPLQYPAGELLTLGEFQVDQHIIPDLLLIHIDADLDKTVDCVFEA